MRLERAAAPAVVAGSLALLATAALALAAPRRASAQPAVENVALSASASASTVTDPYEASLGNDDDPTTSWFSTGPEDGTSTYLLALAEPVTVTRVEFVDNDVNETTEFRTGFGFGSWKINLLGADSTHLFTIESSEPGTQSQSHDVPNVENVVEVLFTGRDHESQDCGGFAELRVFGFEGRAPSEDTQTITLASGVTAGDRDAATGVSAGGDYEPAYTFSPTPSNYATPIEGTAFIGAGPAGLGVAEASYVSEFVLPDPFSDAALTVLVHADNWARISLNGREIGAQPEGADPANFQGAPEQFDTADQSLFTSGTNRLEILVFNAGDPESEPGSGNPAGLDFKATITYVGAPGAGGGPGASGTPEAGPTASPPATASPTARPPGTVPPGGGRRRPLAQRLFASHPRTYAPFAAGGTAGLLAAGIAAAALQLLQGGALALSSQAQSVASRRPLGRRDERDDERRDDSDAARCRAEIARLDLALEAALVRVRAECSSYELIRFQMTAFERIAAEARVRLAQLRAYIDDVRERFHDMMIRRFIDATVWSTLGSAIEQTNTVAGRLGSAGMSAWGRSNLVSSLHTRWEELQQMWHMGPWSDQFQQIVQLVELIDRVGDSAVDVLEARAQALGLQLDEQRASIGDATARADEAWEQRKDTFDDCRDAGHLPADAWDRPQPTYTYGPDGTVTGVS